MSARPMQGIAIVFNNMNPVRHNDNKQGNTWQIQAIKRWCLAWNISFGQRTMGTIIAVPTTSSHSWRVILASNKWKWSTKDAFSLNFVLNEANIFMKEELRRNG